MRLPDPFTNPEIALGFESASLIDNDPVIRDELPNAKVLEVRTSSQYWGIEITYPDMYPEEYFFFDAFISEYKRTGGYIDVLLPQYENLRVKGDPKYTSIPTGQKGSTLQIQGMNSLLGNPKPGDIFKLSTHSKVYKITNVVRQDDTLTLNLYPPLAITTTGNEKPVFNMVLFRTKLLNGDAMKATINSDGMYPGFTLSLRESL